MNKLRLMLVDDQSMFRDGVAALLALKPEFEVVAEASDGAEAVDLARRSKPDVILMDLRMPGTGGVQAIKKIKAELPDVRIVVLTTFNDDEEVFAAVRAGAVGYLLKASSAEKLYEAVELAAKNGSPLDPSVAAKLMAEFTRLANRQSAPAKPAVLIESLSGREREVLRCLADGLSNKEIAQRLSVSEGTIKNHLSQIFGKLGAADRTQAALFARELGLWSG